MGPGEGTLERSGGGGIRKEKEGLKTPKVQSSDWKRIAEGGFSDHHKNLMKTMNYFPRKM